MSLEQHHHHLSETTKHFIDFIALIGGGSAAFTHWFGVALPRSLETFVNPVMTFLVSLATLIWMIYRIIEMHEKRIQEKKKSEPTDKETDNIQ